MKKNLFTLTIGLLLLLIVALLLLTFQVRTSEVAVVTTFGRPTRTITEPGPHFRLPWPIENVHHLDQRVQNFEDKLTECLTQDSFNLLTSVYVGWKITNAAAFYPKFASGSDPIAAAEAVLEGRLSNAKAAVLGKHPLADLLAPGGEGNKFAEIESEILAGLQKEIQAFNYGLEIEFLGLKRLNLPDKVTQSVFERMQAERKKVAETLQSQGESEAAKIKAEAERRAAELVSSAEGEAIKIKGEGEAEAAKYLPVFQQNPELANFIFSMNAIENSLKDRSILIFDQNTPPYQYLRGNLPTNLLHK
jgi:membrane protease subunit HflC